MYAPRGLVSQSVCCDVNSRRKWELQYHTRVANVMYFRSCTVPYGTNVTYIRSCTIPRYGTGTGTSRYPTQGPHVKKMQPWAVRIQDRARAASELAGAPDGDGRPAARG